MALSLPEEVLKSMRACSVILHHMVATLPDLIVRTRSAPHEWAVIEVVAHMADVDERTLARLERMLAEDQPFLPGFDHEELAHDRHYLRMDLMEQLTRYEHTRAAHIARLEQLNARAWERTGEHASHNTMTVLLYEAHVESEDIDHLAQIVRTLAVALSDDA